MSEALAGLDWDLPIAPGHFEVSRGFSLVATTHPVDGDMRPHFGIDLKAREGEPIRAWKDGVILRAVIWDGVRPATTADGKAGTFIKVRHAGGYVTKSFHCYGIAPGLHPGVTVKRGQIIAWVGNTGSSTGPHLHWQLHDGTGTPVDPATYLEPPRAA